MNWNFNEESSGFPFWNKISKNSLGLWVLNMLMFLVIFVVVTVSDPGIPTKYGIPYSQKHRASSIEPVLSRFFVYMAIHSLQLFEDVTLLVNGMVDILILLKK